MGSETTVKPQPTEFQAKILEYVATAPNRQASTWVIAQDVFPARWNKPSGRGALIGHIVRAGHKLVQTGQLGCLLPPADQWGEHTLCGLKPSLLPKSQ
jgi:hypothetical protein